MDCTKVVIDGRIRAFYNWAGKLEVADSIDDVISNNGCCADVYSVVVTVRAVYVFYEVYYVYTRLSIYVHVYSYDVSKCL